jgi:hypothetical protein
MFFYARTRKSIFINGSAGSSWNFLEWTSEMDLDIIKEAAAGT